MPPIRPKHHKDSCECPICEAARKPKMSQVLIGFYPEQHEHLRALAQKRESTVNALVREAIEIYNAANPLTQDPEWLETV